MFEDLHEVSEPLDGLGGGAFKTLDATTTYGAERQG